MFEKLDDKIQDFETSVNAFEGVITTDFKSKCLT